MTGRVCTLALVAATLTSMAQAVPAGRSVMEKRANVYEINTVTEVVTIYRPGPSPVAANDQDSVDEGEDYDDGSDDAEVYVPVVTPIPTVSAPADPVPLEAEEPVSDDDDEDEAVPPAPEPVDTTPEGPSQDDSEDNAAGGVTSGSESADCSGPGQACKGKMTWWQGGLGACGDQVGTDSENAIALPYEYMGEESNTNDFCGKKVVVTNPDSGTTVTGTIKDKCMSCFNRHIDLTKTMFDAVSDGQGDGVLTDFTWYIEE